MEIKIKSLSVIIPCYNEEDVIESTINKIESIANRLQDDLKIISSYEIVVVNNGSTDETLKRSVQFVKKVKNYSVINLKKNYGYHASYCAGLFSAKNDMVITLSADLAEDPNMMEELIKTHYKTNNCVLGVYRERKVSLIKDIFSNIYYFVLSLMNIKSLRKHADFRLLTRQDVKKIIQLQEKYIFLRILIFQVIENYEIIHYSGQIRTKGKSKFSFLKSLLLAFDTIIYYSKINFRKFLFFLCKLLFFMVVIFLVNLYLFNFEFTNIFVFINFIVICFIFLVFLSTFFIQRRFLLLTRDKHLFEVKEIIK